MTKPKTPKTFNTPKGLPNGAAIAARTTLVAANGDASLVQSDPSVPSGPSVPHIPFALENLQHLTPEEALQCQSLLGHGTTWGIWRTPKKKFPHVRKSNCEIDIAVRIRAYLTKDLGEGQFDELAGHSTMAQLMAEAVLYLTRLAVLCRLGPVGYGPHARGKPLDVSTLGRTLHQCWPRIVARGIRRSLSAAVPALGGFASALQPEDLAELTAKAQVKLELNRLKMLVDQKLWFDAPQQVTFKAVTTRVGGPKPQPADEQKRTPYQPLPDAYMEQIGPRVLWLINDLGPNLIHLLEHLRTQQEQKRFKQTASLSRCIAAYFKDRVWHDRSDRDIEAPPFALRLSEKGKAVKLDKTGLAWPPRDYADVMSLAATLQRSHLFIALLLMAARGTEVLTLERGCVKEDADGQYRVRGKTYKASDILEGKGRTWPAPSILIHAFAQQQHLIRVSERVEALLHTTLTSRKKKLKPSLTQAPIVAAPESEAESKTQPKHLWGSLGVGGLSDATVPLEHLGSTLPELAVAVGLDDEPGGDKIHPHRLRKTLARLGGLALDGAIKPMMLLLGHEDVQTTLYYIQTDPDFKVDLLQVVRELRLMRIKGVVELVHQALHEAGSLPHGGIGGGGAPVLTQTVRNFEQTLHRQGRQWGAESSMELAELLADSGRAGRLVAPGVMCTKALHQVGLCNHRAGTVAPENCKVECNSHVELATYRRDVQQVIPILVQQATAFIESNQFLPAVAAVKQLEDELSRFDDIGAHWRDKPEVHGLLTKQWEGLP